VPYLPKKRYKHDAIIEYQVCLSSEYPQQNVFQMSFSVCVRDKGLL